MNHPLETDDDRPNFARWAVFFALAYMVQGFAQTTGILAQPINYFFKVGHGYGAAQLAAVTFWVTFPWYIKPVYGLLADFIPFLGYRRRSYLIVSCLLSFGAFLLVFRVTDPKMIVYALILTSLCTAVGDVMVDGLMVEKGNKLGRVKFYQGLQWTTISVVGIFAAMGGGWLADHAKETGRPEAGVHIAALIAMLGPAMLLVGTWFIVRERKAILDADGIARTARGFRQAIRSKPLLGVILFVTLFWFQPGLISAMYLHTTQRLGISETAVGISGSWAYGGFVGGAVLFMAVLGPWLSSRKLAMLSIVLYAGSTFAYLGLRGTTSLYVLSVVYGLTYMIANLTLLSLAAQVCPRHVEAFVFAFLMGLFNFVKQGSEYFGGVIYDKLVPAIEGGKPSAWSNLDLGAFGLPHAIDPLIVLSGCVTLLAFVFVPLLPKHDGPATPDAGEDLDARPCSGCGYDLRATPAGDACPECGVMSAADRPSDT